MDGLFHINIPCALSHFRNVHDFFFAVPLEQCPLFAAVVDSLRADANTNLSVIKERTHAELTKRGAGYDNNLAICCSAKKRCQYCHSVSQHQVICNSGPSVGLEL